MAGSAGLKKASTLEKPPEAVQRSWSMEGRSGNDHGARYHTTELLKDRLSGEDIVLLVTCPPGTRRGS